MFVYQGNFSLFSGTFFTVCLCFPTRRKLFTKEDFCCAHNWSMFQLTAVIMAKSGINTQRHVKLFSIAQAVSNDNFNNIFIRIVWVFLIKTNTLTRTKKRHEDGKAVFKFDRISFTFPVGVDIVACFAKLQKRQLIW